MKDKSSKKKIDSISKERGLGISCMYPTPINEIEEIKEQFRDKSFPSAKLLSDRLITMPTHHLVSTKDLRNAYDLVRSFN
jgi:dTDP-4-amino-4,6-dideoxygalactose transaminase